MAKEGKSEHDRPQSRIEQLVDKLTELADRPSFWITWTGGKAIIPEEDFINICNELVESQPEEVMEARKILARRDDILRNAHEEAQHVLETAQRRLDEMTSEQEIVRQAHREADRIIRDAEVRGGQIRLEALEYVYVKMEELERQFTASLNTVKNGKQLLEKELAQISAQSADNAPDA
ncbi:MAG: hypothetical protein HRF49_11310 [bacterium]|jgi:polyhydroxyalkanoate synthesis regulator phasin